MSTHSLPVSQYGWSVLRDVKPNFLAWIGVAMDALLLTFYRYFLYKTRRCGLKNTKRLLSLQLVVINMNLKFHI